MSHKYLKQRMLTLNFWFPLSQTYSSQKTTSAFNYFLKSENLESSLFSILFLIFYTHTYTYMYIHINHQKILVIQPLKYFWIHLLFSIPAVTLWYRLISYLACHDRLQIGLPFLFPPAHNNPFVYFVYKVPEWSFLV